MLSLSWQGSDLVQSASFNHSLPMLLCFMQGEEKNFSSGSLTSPNRGLERTQVTALQLNDDKADL
jgi:hypothetical protein